MTFAFWCEAGQGDFPSRLIIGRTLCALFGGR
jgi:hypothetical protein